MPDSLQLAFWNVENLFDVESAALGWARARWI